MFELVFTCIEAHIFAPVFSTSHIFISIIKFFCFLLLLGKLLTWNIQDSNTHIQHHIYTIFEIIFVVIWLLECQYFVFQLVIRISWSRSSSLASESEWIFDMTSLIITLVVHEYAPCFVYYYDLCIMDVPIPQLHLFVTLHLIHKFYII